jgi:hypothetical protein
MIAATPRLLARGRYTCDVLLLPPDGRSANGSPVASVLPQRTRNAAFVAAYYLARELTLQQR